MVNFAAADLDGLVRFVNCRLKKIKYRPDPIHGCLPPAAWPPNPGKPHAHEFNLVRSGFAERSRLPGWCYLARAGADTWSMAADSSSLSSSKRAPEFSRTCSGLVAPGIAIT